MIIICIVTALFRLSLPPRIYRTERHFMFRRVKKKAFAQFRPVSNTSVRKIKFTP